MLVMGSVKHEFLFWSFSFFSFNLDVLVGAESHLLLTRIWEQLIALPCFLNVVMAFGSTHVLFSVVCSIFGSDNGLENCLIIFM